MEDSINNIVKCAIKLSEVEIHTNPNIILSESDFEDLIVNKIRALLLSQSEKYGVHHQISFYRDGITPTFEEDLDKQHETKAQSNKSTRNYQVDIVILEMDKMKRTSEHRKGFKYTEPACAIEVKYLHDNEESKIEGDLKKSSVLCKGEKGSYLWCVALIDSRKTQKYEQIKEWYNQYRNNLDDRDKSKLKCALLYKKDRQIDWIHEE